MELFPPSIPLHVQLEVTYACNHACTFCYNPLNNSAARPLPSSDMFRIIDHLFEAGVLQLSFTGGEPLIREDILQLIAYAKHKGFLVGLVTNGTLLSEEVCHQLADFHVDYLMMSFLARQSDSFDRLTQRSGSYEKAVRSLERLKRYDLPFGINMPVVCSNLAEVEDVAAIVYQFGAKLFSVTRFVPIGRGSTMVETENLNWEQLHYLFDLLDLLDRTYPQMQIRLDTAIPFCALGRDIVPHWYSRCDYGATKCYVDPAGDLKFCGFIPLTFGSLLENNLKSLWNGASMLAERRNLGDLPVQCKSCKHLPQCGAGCRASMYCSGEANGGDPLMIWTEAEV